jgi:hypothetical protein
VRVSVCVCVCVCVSGWYRTAAEWFFVSGITFLSE